MVGIFGSDPYVGAPLTDQLVRLQGCVFFGHGALVELHNSVSVAYEECHVIYFFLFLVSACAAYFVKSSEQSLAISTSATGSKK